jgi:hypothetical protein
VFHPRISSLPGAGCSVVVVVGVVVVVDVMGTDVAVRSTLPVIAYHLSVSVSLSLFFCAVRRCQCLHAQHAPILLRTIWCSALCYTCSTFAFVSNISFYLLSTPTYLPTITASPSLSVSASLMFSSSVLSFLSPRVCVLVFTMEWGLPFHSVWYEAITGLLVPEPVSYKH